MNANELADLIYKLEDGYDDPMYSLQAATMLRQQDYEIKALKAENQFFKDIMGDVEILRKAQEK